MKVAVSLPNQVFEEAERVSKRLRVSRSRLYAQALEELVAKHRSQGVREALDRVYADQESEVDPIVKKLQARALRETW